MKITEIIQCCYATYRVFMGNIIGDPANTCDMFLHYHGDGKYEYEIFGINGLRIEGKIESHPLGSNWGVYSAEYKDNDELICYTVNWIYAHHMQKIVDAYVGDTFPNAVIPKSSARHPYIKTGPNFEHPYSKTGPAYLPHDNVVTKATNDKLKELVAKASLPEEKQEPVPAGRIPRDEAIRQWMTHPPIKTSSKSEKQEINITLGPIESLDTIVVGGVKIKVPGDVEILIDDDDISYINLGEVIP